jgi:hypothetical protein
MELQKTYTAAEVDERIETALDKYHDVNILQLWQVVEKLEQQLKKQQVYNEMLEHRIQQLQRSMDYRGNAPQEEPVETPFPEASEIVEITAQHFDNREEAPDGTKKNSGKADYNLELVIKTKDGKKLRRRMTPRPATDKRAKADLVPELSAASGVLQFIGCLSTGSKFNKKKHTEYGMAIGKDWTLRMSLNGEVIELGCGHSTPADAKPNAYVRRWVWNSLAGSN